MSDVLSEGARDPRARRVTDALAGTALGPVAWVSETGSTNADLLAVGASGGEHGRVLVADHQTAGRGRRDRRWESGPGDALMMSVLLVPTDGAGGLSRLTTAVGIAAATACAELGVVGIGLKWPNDLVVGPAGDHRKLAGILAQSVVSPSVTAAVVGLGLNVRGARLRTLAPDAIALDDVVASPDREQVLVGILRALDPLLGMSATALRERHLALSATVGTDVQVTTDDSLLAGRAVDVTTGGALVVDVGGERREIVVGDVISVRPDASA